MAKIQVIREGYTLVKENSHRSRRKLYTLLGGPQQAWYSFDRAGNWYWVPDDMAEQALAITGITAAKDWGDLRKCWGSEISLNA